MNTLLEVKNLRMHFVLQKALPPFFSKRILKAVDNVSFSIGEGEVLGLVGESGCGKSTIARVLTRLDVATAGTVHLQGTDILNLSKAQFQSVRRHIQMIFQDPFASLNPRLTIKQTLAEPLRIHGIAKTRDQCRRRIADMLAQVGMEAGAIRRYPHEFSGGQRQRIGIARAMILSPRLLIADEPVSALDVSIQAQVLTLIKKIQKDHNVGMLFISHDLGVIRHVCDRVAVMYLGRIVEIAPARELFSRAVHPYTRLLLQSIPRPDPSQPGVAVPLGEPASAADPPAGCAFHPRCLRATDICRTRTPKLDPLEARSHAHQAACHHRYSEEVHT